MVIGPKQKLAIAQEELSTLARKFTKQRDKGIVISEEDRERVIALRKDIAALKIMIIQEEESWI